MKVMSVMAEGGKIGLTLEKDIKLTKPRHAWPERCEKGHKSMHTHKYLNDITQSRVTT